MIRVYQDEPGTITLDLSEEESFNLSDDGTLLLMGVGVREMREDAAVIEDGGQPGQVLTFVDVFFRDRGIELSYDDTLARLLRLFREEQVLVAAVRSGNPPAGPPLSKASLGMKRDL